MDIEVRNPPPPPPAPPPPLAGKPQNCLGQLGCVLTLTLTPIALGFLYLCWKAWAPEKGFFEFLDEFYEAFKMGKFTQELVKDLKYWEEKCIEEINKINIQRDKDKLQDKVDLQNKMNKGKIATLIGKKKDGKKG